MANDCINYYSLNIRGIGCDKKAKEAILWLKKKYNGIIFLQETHGNNIRQKFWEREWGGNIYSSHGSTNSKGVSILFPKNLEYETINVKTDKEGRYIILTISMYEVTYCLVNCYLPTKDNENYQLKILENIEKDIEGRGDCCLIIGGDFNVTLEPKTEKKGGKISEKESKIYRNTLKGMLVANNLEDVVRNAYPEENLYTWHCKGKGISSRLDY